MEILIAIALTLVGLASWVASLIGLPGNWILAAIAAGLWWFVDPAIRVSVGQSMLAAIIGIGLVGEALETLASVLGVSRLGGTQRSALLSMAGSVIGAVGGLFIGVPIPIIGSLAASLVCSAAGAYLGAVLGQRWSGHEWKESAEIGNAAFWGRILGTVAKAACGTIATSLFLVAIWL